MRRREFISAAALLPLAARAQASSKLYRLGYLAEARFPHLIEALQAALRELGYVEGKNLKMEYRFGGTRRQSPERLQPE
jgi:putative ABC transport system substrate-binding protein